MHNVTLTSALETPFPQNNRQPARWYRPRAGQAKGTILFLHGVMAFNYWGYEWITAALARAGWQVLFVHLPYHLERTPPGFRPGEFFVLGNLLRAMEMARQGVIELRQVIAALQRNGHGPVGVVGVSLGGWFGGLLATLEPALDFAALIVPALDLRTVFSESPLAMASRPHQKHVPLETSNRILLALSPSYARPVIPRERILLARADWDMLVPRHTIDEARERWQPGTFLTYPDGHISLAFRRQLRADLIAFADRQRDYTPQRSIEFA